MTILRGLGERNSLPHLMVTVSSPPPTAELLSLPGPAGLVSARELSWAGVWQACRSSVGLGFWAHHAGFDGVGKLDFQPILLG